MEFDGAQIVVEEGTDVYGSDGEKVGSVVAVQPGYLVVEKGFFFPTDYYIPRSALASYDDGKLFLTVSKEEALTQGWDQVPADDEVIVGTSEASWSEDARLGEATGQREATTVEAQETLSVPVHEEHLRATTREEEIGQVAIEKNVISEEQTLQVPVREERVRVERHAVDRPVAASDREAFEDQVIEVPLRGETVEAQKEVRVAEEIEIGKEAVERSEDVRGTVRREEVEVRERVSGEQGRGRSTTDTSDTIDTGILPDEDFERDARR
ncbi:MAG: DUF2382 domain-containing protein [Chloroflexota bacterium]|nr:DUF2382 domain-containing protein [Chloroflexota bacterium]